MKPYSLDLRERVLKALRKGQLTQPQIAAKYDISLRTVETWARRWRETGGIQPKPHRSGPGRTLAAATAVIRTALAEQPDLTLDELCGRVATQAQVRASASMMCRELQHLQLPRKKALHDSQRETPRVQKMRRVFHAQIRTTLRQIAPQLKFIDESGAHLGLTRLFGRAAPGVRVTEATSGYSGKHYTLIAALSLTEVSAPWLLEAAMTREAFEVYVAQVLVPTLRAGDVVLIDNLNVHKSETARQLIEACGARLEFLPPYSPDLNPIEKCWAKLKAVLRRLKARTFDELLDALDLAFQSITPQDARAWFAHCGYLLPHTK